MAEPDENPFGDPTPSVGHPFQVIILMFFFDCKSKNVALTLI